MYCMLCILRRVLLTQAFKIHQTTLNYETTRNRSIKETEYIKMTVRSLFVSPCGRWSSQSMMSWKTAV